MKTISRLVLAASLVAGIAIATATVAMAQGMQGGMDPGMMKGDRMTGSASMPEGSAGQGMMGGPGMMQGMGQGMMCPMMSRMMQGCMDHGMMGHEMTEHQMMGHGMMGSGMMGQGAKGAGMTPGGAGGMFGSRVTPIMNLSVDDVRGYLDVQLERLNNKRLKIGNIQADGGTISAEIVTVDNSLVQRLKVDRRTGAIEYEN